MPGLKLALPLFTLLVLLSTLSAARCSTPAYLTRPGTIAHALAQPDGTEVCLDAVNVDKIVATDEPAYFVVNEEWNYHSRIIVAAPPPVAIRSRETVDIAGELCTLPNGQRAICRARVIGYLDEEGNLLLTGPRTKGLMAPTPWPYRAELSFNSLNHLSGQSLEASSLAASLLDYPPGPDPNPNPWPAPEQYATIADLLAAEPDDGTIVKLQCMNISSVDAGASFVMSDDAGTASMVAYYTGISSGYARVNGITGTVHTDSGVRVLDVNSGPEYDPQGYTGAATLTESESISWAKTFADDTVLEVSLEQSSVLSGIVSAVFSAARHFYIQNSSRTAAVRIDYDTSHIPVVSLYVGKRVNITGGTVGTIGGERVISNPSVTDPNTPENAVIDPLGTNSSRIAFGGGAANIYTPGITDGGGLCVKGLLMRVWGKITAVGSNCFYVDDGGGAANDLTNQKGLKVDCTWAGAISAPNVGHVVQVTGICGSEPHNSDLIPVLRIRTQQDILAPTISITSPLAGTLHTAASSVSLHITGTTTQDIFPIAAVNCVVVPDLTTSPPTSGWSQDVSGTNHWSYDSGSLTSGNYTIWAKASSTQDTVFASCQIIISPISSGVIYVNGSSPNAADDSTHGGSWAVPFKTVGYATGGASAGQEVWVAAGKYKLDDTINILSSLGLYGGFSGTETAREQRNWTSNSTILDGLNVGFPIVWTNAPQFIIDGFVMQGGSPAIICDSSNCTISHNVIRKCYGAISVMDSSSVGPIVTITDNFILANQAGIGFSSTGSGGYIVNNTIVDNASVCGYACLAIDSGNPLIANNIVAYNQSGISKGGASFHKNYVYGNTDYLYDPPTPPADDINAQADPDFVDRTNGDLHIFWGSPCRDAGYDSGLPSMATDIDSESRRVGAIDIGADETTATVRYAFTFTPQSSYTVIGASVKVTAHVTDKVINQPMKNLRVNVSVDTGEIVSVTNAGTTITLPPGCRSAYGTTNAEGNLEVYVTSASAGPVIATAGINVYGWTMTKSAKVYYANPVETDIVFLVDDTPSTQLRRQTMLNGICDTVDYVASHMPAGRTLRVAGIRFSDGYPCLGGLHTNGIKYDFTPYMSDFKDWLNDGTTNGIGYEYQLDIMMYAKDMAPSSETGLYMALATDEASNSDISKYTVVDALDMSNSIVFIDPGVGYNPNPPYEELTTYYQPLAVNGGAVEGASMGTFTFPLMRQTILGAP